MNISKIMASMLLLPAAVACTTGEKAADEVIVERPDVTVQDGKFTPEVLMALGGVSSPVVSPDGKKVLYSVSFTSLEHDKSNAELWVVGIDGSNPVRLTQSPKSE